MKTAEKVLYHYNTFSKALSTDQTILHLFVVSVNYIAVLIGSSAACVIRTSAHIRAGTCRTLGSLIYFCKQCLSAVHQLLSACLDIFDLRVCHLRSELC